MERRGLGRRPHRAPGLGRGRLGAGSLRVELSSYGVENASGTRIWISGPNISTDLTLRPERARDSSSGARELEVGDPAFDRAAWVEGPPALVRSLLDAGTRRAMLGLIEGRLERPPVTPFAAEGRVELGVLGVDVPDFTGDAGWSISTELLAPQRPRVDASGQLCACGSAQLPAVLGLLLANARRLETPEDVPRRLAAAREDPDAEVRLRAGLSLGPEGRDAILAIARGEGAPDETTARAVAALAGELSADEAAALLRSALRTRRQGTAHVCLRVLGRRRDPVVVPTLAKVLAVAKPELAAAAADALGTTGDASAERALLTALDSPHPAVRAAAARALGRVGTTAAVQPLKELEGRDRACRAAARQAVGEIQSRLAGAEPGQLSLAGGESGQLSLAEGEEGRLTLAERTRGGGSFATGQTGVAQDDGADPSRPGRRESLRMTGRILRDRAERSRSG